jgi:hypothetical protein
VAVDQSGNVWVANYGSNNVTKLSSAGATLGTYSVGSNPIGVAVDQSGNVWVANASSNNVTKLSSAGATLGTYSVGSGPQYDVAVDQSGNVWVANYGSNNVTKLSSGSNGVLVPLVQNLPQASGVKPDGTSILNTAGVLSATPGSIGADVSGAAATAQSNAEAYASNASNLTSGTVAAAQVATLNQNTTGTAANVTGIVAVANGGTGTATPGLVAGTNVTISGTWPDQTVNAMGGVTINRAVIHASWVGAPLLSSQAFGLFINDSSTSISVPSGCTNSTANAMTAATASTILTILNCSTAFGSCSSVGTIAFAASGTSGTFTCSSGFTVGSDYGLYIKGPATADATLGNIAIALYGTHN